jgi:hypothetical protein
MISESGIPIDGEVEGVGCGTRRRVQDGELDGVRLDHDVSPLLKDLRSRDCETEGGFERRD